VIQPNKYHVVFKCRRRTCETCTCRVVCHDVRQQKSYASAPQSWNEICRVHHFSPQSNDAAQHQLFLSSSSMEASRIAVVIFSPIVAVRHLVQVPGGLQNRRVTCRPDLRHLLSILLVRCIASPHVMNCYRSLIVLLASIRQL
jgi:hypothetical protein